MDGNHDHEIGTGDGLPTELDDDMLRQVVQIRQLPETVDCPHEERSWGDDCAEGSRGEAA